MSAPQVVLRTPWDGPWQAFAGPDAMFEATAVADVRDCLAEVDRAVRRTGSRAAGFVTYEAAAAFGLPVLAPAGTGLPLVWFGLYTPARIATLARIEVPPARPDAEWRPSVTREHYRDRIRRIRSHIAAGDTYQINYTWRLVSPFDGDPLALFAALDAAQGGRWSAFVDIGRHAICSASPELFFIREGERIRCRPMKGTARRGLWTADDLDRAAALAASEKNRAENVMVVDMTRNDLGRIARVGSVHVDRLFDVERYPGQWQMTSEVSAELRDTALPLLFEALFPSGSVTGAPKHRSMQIIGGMEAEPRGIYTGAIGVVGPDRAHFNIAIRTVDVDRQSGTAVFGVGSGVVWDSIDRDEYDECLVKATILTAQPPAFDLLETIGWHPGQGFVLLEGHLDRLDGSASYFGFVPPSHARIRAALDEAVAGASAPQRLRLIYGRDGGVRVEGAALVLGDAPLRAAIAPTPVSPDDVFLFHKTTRREVYDAARRSRPDADAVILWNVRGEITEATEANVVVDLEGRRVTPPLGCGLLPGVFRAGLLARGEVVEGVVRRDDLRRARAVWLVNSVRGWMGALLV